MNPTKALSLLEAMGVDSICVAFCNNAVADMSVDDDDEYNKSPTLFSWLIVWSSHSGSDGGGMEAV